jgi:alanine dehydrogenase
MKIGVPKEIKSHEYRVGLVPQSVQTLVNNGHQVFVQTAAGAGIGVSDQDYINAGAVILATANEIYAVAELIIKVKEPQPEECLKLKPQQIIFTFLHLAALPELSDLLVRSGAIAFAYETVTDKHGKLPLLAPMSDIAGRIAVQEGAHYLEKPYGGRGVLIGGVPGAAPAKVTVLGGGVVGNSAIQVALGMGANVTVLDKSETRLQELAMIHGSKLQIVTSTADNIAANVVDADIVIGGVLVAGAAAPKLVTKEIVAKMMPGAVIVDVAIDQGGCIETSRPTNFSDPIFIEYGVVHQCVTNLPGAVPRTSAFALNNATLPFILELANNGYKNACLSNPHLMAGLNICDGKITHESVAKALQQPYFAAAQSLV